MDDSAPIKSPRLYIGVSLAGFLAMVVFVCTRPRGVFFDETYLFTQVRLFSEAESFRSWLLGNKTAAMGPVHALFYHALWGREPLPPPWLRVPNLALLGVALITMTAVAWRLGLRAPVAVGLAALGVPMTWVTGGIALSEMPAMASVTIALYAAVRLGAMVDPVEGSRRVFWSAILAMALAMAVCTRQTYIVIVPALGLLAWSDVRGGVQTGVALTLGLLPPFWLFATWGGLTPPLMRSLMAGLETSHAVSAVCTIGAVSALLAPRLFWEHRRVALLTAIVTGAVQLVLRPVTMGVLDSALRFVGNPELTAWLSRGVVAGMVATGAAWTFTLAAEVRRGHDRKFIALALAVLLLCGVCAGIKSQYSSRYAAMAIPFLLPLLGRWMDFGAWGTARLSIGMGVGFAALHSHYLYG